MKSAGIPSKCLKDPQFVKILTASLCSQIAEGKKMLVDMDGEIQELKKKVEHGLERRRVIKQIAKDSQKKKAMQEGALESLTRDGKKRAIELETVKKGLDDTTLRQKTDRAKYEKILEDYGLMWEQYKAEYEEFPLAKEREESRVTVKKLEIQLMIIEYKRDELINMLKQRKIIDAMRIREAGVDIAKMILQRWEDEKYLEDLQKFGAALQDELKAYDRELQEKIERSKLADIETAEMPPPRLNFSFMRPVYSTQRNTRNDRRCDPSSPSRDSDTMSVNTLILERMCKDDTNYKEVQNARKAYRPSQMKSVDDIPSMIQEVSDPNNIPEPMNIVESNIKDKMGKLHIKKNKVPRMEEPKFNEGVNHRNRMDDGAGEVERNDYQLDPREAFQRTRRWCEESRKKIPSYDPEERRLISANDPKQMESNDDGFRSDGREMAKDLSIHESEASYMNSSRWSFNNEPGTHRCDNTAQQNWTENVPSENLSQGSLLGKRKLNQPTPNPEPAVPMDNNDVGYDEEEKTNDYAAHESPRSDETLETPIIPNANRPRVTNIEKVNFAFGQRPAMGVNANPFANLGSNRNYAPSYASSCNLSPGNEPAHHLETPQGTFMSEYENIPVSPINSELFNMPRGLSTSSFTSTIADQQPKAKNAINQPTQKQNPVPPMNFDGFNFAKKSKLTKHTMF